MRDSLQGTQNRDSLIRFRTKEEEVEMKVLLTEFSFYIIVYLVEGKEFPLGLDSLCREMMPFSPYEL
jgi:hypothetical protein